MPVLIAYFLKLSLSLVVVYLFYQLVLRRLTFYGLNRWYLLGYSLLSFFIPFININPLLERNELAENKVLLFIPSVQSYATEIENVTDCPEPIGFMNWNKWEWIQLVLLIGAVVLLIRFLVRYLSFLKISRKAVLLSGGETRIYQVDKDIIPFSFGNAIYVNQSLHTPAEMEEIIRHEFVHVRQRHTIDILLGELLCMLNWYNPFVWMLRKSIRQNLEFIADDKVVQTGIDKKQYQYLLLKVIGNNHYSIANQFNFSSLKKRIDMMNKLKTSPIHLLRLLLLLPAVAIVLLAFRQKANKPVWESREDKAVVYVAGLVVDASTMEPLPFATLEDKESKLSAVTDKNGYYKLEIPFKNEPLQFHLTVTKDGYETLSNQENWENFSDEWTYAAYGKSIEFFGLVKKGQTGKGFGSIAGNVTDISQLDYDYVLFQLSKSFYKRQASYTGRERDTIPQAKEWNPIPTASEEDFVRRHPAIKKISWAYMVSVTQTNRDGGQSDANIRGDKAGDMFMTITFKNGKWDMYNVNKESDIQKFRKNYGELPPAAPAAPVAQRAAQESRQAGKDQFKQRNPGVKEYWFSYFDTLEPVRSITVALKSGEVESFDLTRDDHLQRFYKLYGSLPSSTFPVAQRSEAVFNNKGYSIAIEDDMGNCTVVVKDKAYKVVDRLRLTDWHKNQNTYENKYGVIPKYLTAVSPKGSITNSGMKKMKEMTFTADEILWASETGTLKLMGKAVLKDGDEITIESDSIELHQNIPLVYINGKEADLNKSYIGKKGEKFRVNILEKEEALKKYGEKGRNGAMEIDSE